MALVKASLLHELDFSINIKRWLQGKRENLDQIASQEYSSRLRQLFRSNLKRRKRARIESLKPVDASEDGRVLIRLSNEHSDGKNLKFAGISIARSNFPGAQRNDKVFLTPLEEDEPFKEDTSKRMVFGIVTSVDSNHIQIRFRSPITLEKIQAEDVEDKSINDKEIDKLCEQNCHKDSDEEEAEERRRELQDGDADVNKSGSGGEDGDNKSSELKFDELKDDADLDKGDQVAKIKQEEEEAIVNVKAKPMRFAIKMEPAEEKNTIDYINCFENALRKFEKQICSAPLHKCLLGQYNNHVDHMAPKSRIVSLNELPGLKYQQEIAVEQSIKRRISLVEGPAGSGKTLVSAHIACNAARVKGYKVLLCSPLQSTVDKLAELVDRVTSIEVIKLPGEHRMKVDGRTALQLAQRRVSQTLAQKCDDPSDEIEILSDGRQLDRVVDDEIYWESWHKTKTIYRNNRDIMHEQAMKQVKYCSSWRRRKIEQKLLNRANVICCTTSQAGSQLIEDLNFDMLIIDDVQLVSEIDCLIPLMVKGLKQITLLSDMRLQIRLARVRNHSRQSTMSILQTQIPSSGLSVAPIIETNEPEEQHQRSNQSSSDNFAIKNETSVVVDSPKSTATMNGLRPTLTLAERKKAAAYGRKKSRRHSKSYSDTSLLINSHTDLTNPASPGLSPCDGPTNELGGLFERWLSIGLPAVDLRHQFRMHETLSSFTNYHFYLNRSKNDSLTNESLANEILDKLLLGEQNFSWLPKSNCLTAMFTSKSSRINQRLDDILDKLINHECVQGSRIGVIFNRKQETFNSDWHSSSVKFGDMVKSGYIEDFAGQERDFIILVAGCCHKDEATASQQAELALCSHIERNFTIDDCTLNVALTRARLGMFIITDMELARAAEHQSGHESPSTSKAADEEERSTSSSIRPRHTDNYCLGWRKLVDHYTTNGIIQS